MEESVQLSTLFRLPVFGVFRGLDPSATVRMCESAWRLGIETVEIPVERPAAMPSLRAAVRAGLAYGRPVGAGTVLTAEQVDEVQAAGAAFTVAPGLSQEVAQRSWSLGMPHVPGVATATEITTATAWGMLWLKVFPAAQLGAAWVRAQRGPFPEAAFLATGGVTSLNAAALIGAGAKAVGIGSDLVTSAGQAAVTALLARSPTPPTR